MTREKVTVAAATTGQAAGAGLWSKDVSAELINEIRQSRWQYHADLDTASLAVGPLRLWITMRPYYCDRGHLWLQAEDLAFPPLIDAADGFPRYFFTLDEADTHARMFLLWRLAQLRTAPFETLKDWCRLPRR